MVSFPIACMHFGKRGLWLRFPSNLLRLCKILNETDTCIFDVFMLY